MGLFHYAACKEPRRPVPAQHYRVALLELELLVELYRGDLAIDRLYDAAAGVESGEYAVVGSFLQGLIGHLAYLHPCHEACPAGYQRGREDVALLHVLLADAL